MATRAIRNLTHVAGSHLSLPAQDHPQLVGEDGFEVDEVTYFGTRTAPQLDAAEGAPTHGEEPADIVISVSEDDNEPRADDSIAPEGPSLLSIADSLIASYSLTQSRIHHINHLLPHIFSHPPIPSHSRPRTRLPPRSTFQFPTPPPPIHPLPNPEYHGPTASGSSSATATNNPPDESAGQAVKSGSSKGKGKEKENQPPAHEIDCIARVTLSIGPTVFPDTELWVGRFVEPRSAGSKVQRIKSDYKEKRKLDMDAATNKKPRLSNTTARPAGPLPQRPPPMPRPNAPSSGSWSDRPPIRPPGRQEVDPVLIQRVNRAAAKNPWLAVLIHKAARQQASKEELSQLGRAVAKLGRGEDVGPTPDPPSTSVSGPTPSGPSSSTTARPAAPRPPPPPVVTPSRSSAPPVPEPAPVNQASKASATDSDDDSDVDMKGPPQEGGGPIPASTAHEPRVTNTQPQTAEHADRSDVASVAPLQSPLSAPTIDPVASIDSGTNANVLPMPPPTTQVRTDAAVQMPPPIPPSQAAGSVPQMPPIMRLHPPPPPPPKPVYPIPPPFLLVAFRELPTEKYLLPLGHNSFVSRVGGDWVTASPPTQTPSAPAPASQQSGQPIKEAIPERIGDSLATPLAVEPASVSGRTRARQSIGKPVKAASPPPPKDPTPPPVEPAVELPPSSGLELLPGMKPEPGTVLLSTLIPPSWLQPDWTELGKSIPFGNPAFQLGIARHPVAVEVKKEILENVEALKPPPVPPHAAGRSPHFPSLLNLGARDFVPPDAPLQPVTIRLSGIDDKVWHQMKSIINVVEQAEVHTIALQESPSSFSRTDPTPTTAPPVSVVMPKARETWRERRKTRFRDLLRRVPSRKFLRMRVETAPSDILEAISDRFALRPYPISTKALYSASPPPDDVVGIATTLSPELSATKRKGPEPAITFEMPVSLDYLDERVEQGAKGLTKKVGQKGEALKADGTPDLRKRGLKRGVAGRICEGCAREGLKVWRMGPGGPSTLCNECGNKFNNGTLGELKAPGSAKVEEEAKEGSAAADQSEHKPAGPDSVPMSADAPVAAPSVEPSADQAGRQAVVPSAPVAEVAEVRDHSTQADDPLATRSQAEEPVTEPAATTETPVMAKSDEPESSEVSVAPEHPEATQKEGTAAFATEAGPENSDPPAANVEMEPEKGDEGVEKNSMEVD